MNEEQPIGLMQCDRNSGVIVWIKDAEQLKAAALEISGVIGRVTCAEEQQAAIDAMKALKTYRDLVEKSRKAVKAPLLDLSGKIDAAAKTEMKEICSEETRIATLVANFQSLELAKVRAAQAAENARLSALERERQAALAEVQSHDQHDAVNAEF